MNKNQIVENVDKIVKTVGMFHKISISDLKLLTRLDYKNIFLALGWLSRENEVTLREDGEKEMYISLPEK